MGIKIKKDVKPQIQKLPKLKIRYNFVVPLIGLLDVVTMLSFYTNFSESGSWLIKAFFLFFAVVGLLFALWAFLWNTTVDGKWIKVHPIIGRAKEVPFANLKKAVIYKNGRTGSLSYYKLIDKKDEEIVKIYPLMRECSALLERLKRLDYPIEEVTD